MLSIRLCCCNDSYIITADLPAPISADLKTSREEEDATFVPKDTNLCAILFCNSCDPQLLTDMNGNILKFVQKWNGRINQQIRILNIKSIFVS